MSYKKPLNEQFFGCVPIFNMHSGLENEKKKNRAHCVIKRGHDNGIKFSFLSHKTFSSVAHFERRVHVQKNAYYQPNL